MTITQSEVPITTTGTVIHLDIMAGTPLPELIAAVNAACDRTEDLLDHAVLTVRIGTARSSGTGAVDVHLLTQWERALRRMERLRALIVATVNGPCSSFAFSALLVADYRIVRDDTVLRIGGTPNSSLPTMALYRLANEIGIARSRRAILLGAPIAAQEALTLGLVDEIAAEPALATERFLETVQGLDTVALAVRRQLLLEAPSRIYEDALGTHLAACERVFRKAAS